MSTKPSHRRVVSLLHNLLVGERIVTTLLPYGPEKPRAGIVKTVLTDAVEISWEPPKGGFTKYVLGVDPQVGFFNIDINSNSVINKLKKPTPRYPPCTGRATPCGCRTGS